jgi:hypothetical protein
MEATVNVWLAEQHNMGSRETLGIFSAPALARKACQGVANQYFGEAKTPALRWLGDDGYASASYHQPPTGMWLFQVTLFVVDVDLQAVELG